MLSTSSVGTLGPGGGRVKTGGPGVLHTGQGTTGLWGIGAGPPLHFPAKCLTKALCVRHHREPGGGFSSAKAAS